MQVSPKSSIVKYDREVPSKFFLRRIIHRMACIEAFYRRLKKIFSSKERKMKVTIDCIDESISLTVNINPFAPIDEEMISKKIDKSLCEKKKSRCFKRKFKGLEICKVLRFTTSQESTESKESSMPSPNLSIEPFELLHSNISRYKREFHELDLLGTGEFGSVYRCVNRLDGCIYAIKRSRALARSCYAQRRAKNEVHANAVINNHRNIVRYYSAWIEDDRMSIQQEYCNGGDLSVKIMRMRSEGMVFEEMDLRRIVLHVAEGLRYIHSMKLAHMDIKPENIFITTERVWTPRPQITCQESGEFSTECNFREEIVYKIGDLGHVASIIDTTEIEDEGDCRYLCKEVLREDYRDLTKADIFALGLTFYEAAGGGPLPKNGPTWHSIRDGALQRLHHYSDDLNNLIRLMTDLDPDVRPSAAKIVKLSFLN